MAFSYGDMVAYASRGTEIRPGDILGSGTCGGCCLAELWGPHRLDAHRAWVYPTSNLEHSPKLVLHSYASAGAGCVSPHSNPSARGAHKLRHARRPELIAALAFAIKRVR